MKNNLFLLLFVIFNSVMYGQSGLNDSKRIISEPKIYRTYGQGKAAGLDIGIRYLDDWMQKDGKRPHVVKKFEKSLDYGRSVSYLMTISQHDKILTREDLKAGHEALKADERNIVVNEMHGLYVEVQPASSIEIKNSRTGETSRGDLTVYSHQKTVSIIYENYLITITYGVGSSSEQEIDPLYNEYKSFFSSVTNGIIIYSKWNK